MIHKSTPFATTIIQARVIRHFWQKSFNPIVSLLFAASTCSVVLAQQLPPAPVWKEGTLQRSTSGNLIVAPPTHDDDSPTTQPVILPSTNTSKSSGALLFLDEFEYTVTDDLRDAASNRQAFIEAGWTNVKATNITGRYLGKLYTTRSIPGYSGNFPGRNSRHVLVMEAQQSLERHPRNQTDFYLQYGRGGSHDPLVLPGNVWFQFWLYTPHTSDQPSWFPRAAKFIYPTNCAWPSTCNKWLFGLTSASRDPLNLEGSSMYPHSPDGHAGRVLFPGIAAANEISRIRWASPGIALENQWKTGQQSRDLLIEPNRWQLIKLHIDTSTQSGRWKMWMRTIGQEWIKVAEYSQEATPYFSWPVAQPGGHSGFRMPTTIDGSRNPSMPFNSWIYMDDFAIASDESFLPQYVR